METKNNNRTDAPASRLLLTAACFGAGVLVLRASVEIESYILLAIGVLMMLSALVLFDPRHLSVS